MNILFYTNQYPDYLLGGIERITSRLAMSLKNKGFRVYNLFIQEYAFPETRIELFDDVKYIPANDLLDRKDDVCNFTRDNKIDVIVVQMIKENAELLLYIKNNCNCKIVYVYHSLPCYEYKWVTFREHVFPEINKAIRNAASISDFINSIRVVKRKTIHALNWNKVVNRSYRTVYDLCDKFIVLSPSFITILKKNIGLKDKLCAIPNMLSYDEFLPERNLEKKEKVVLIVARMDEVQKKISKALQFWKEIESDSRLFDWTLEIVGDGPSLDSYKQYAAENLKRVTFFGKQEPKDFYKRAAIFMMTSAFEGWGITLTEAQQFGCVPIVLNTFSAAGDIISNSKDGILINREQNYVAELKHLLLDSERRDRMAENAIKSSSRYSNNNVTEKWLCLFSGLKIS